MDQDKLEQILPTQDLIEKISTMPCFGWKNLRIIRKGWQNRCNWPLITLRCYTRKSVKDWMPAVVGFFSLSNSGAQPEAIEMVIERVLSLDNAEFELDDLKWVILMVLFNIPGCENVPANGKNYSLK